MKKKSWYNLILIIIILACIILLVLQNFSSITGHATSGTADSNVTISKFLSIELSTNLSSGIPFGSVSTLPATNINSTHNFDGNESETETSMFINVSTDSNTNVDFCIKANASLTSPDLDVIGLDNETYANSTNTNISFPAVGSEVSLTTDYVKAGGSIEEGYAAFYRFWLDIPAAQPSGDYVNKIYFKGVETGQVCGT
ncbi:MAG: hypothetical protein ABH804_01855 [archaeon]